MMLCLLPNSYCTIYIYIYEYVKGSGTCLTVFLPAPEEEVHPAKHGDT